MLGSYNAANATVTTTIPVNSTITTTTIEYDDNNHMELGTSGA